MKTHESTGRNPGTVTYGYDLAGHPLGFADNSASIVVPATVGTVGTVTSTYDGLNNLTGNVWSPTATQTAPAVTSALFTYTYDATNRRLSQTATDNTYWSYPTATAATVSYTANNLDQYSAIGSVTPTYDGNGNLTFDGAFTYGYDAESRLVSASGAGQTASYAYDAQGRRKSKTVNGTTTVFVQDPQGGRCWIMTGPPVRSRTGTLSDRVRTMCSTRSTSRVPRAQPTSPTSRVRSSRRSTQARAR